MRGEWRSLDDCQVEPSGVGSAFDIKAEFDVVVVAIADAAAVAGGRDDGDDEKGINMHAKTFRSKEEDLLQVA